MFGLEGNKGGKRGRDQRPEGESKGKVETYLLGGGRISSQERESRSEEGTKQEKILSSETVREKGKKKGKR